MVIAGDHGEGLGDHGESLHGNLLYQSTMHVPFVVVGPGVTPGVSDTPVSTRRVFHTILDWAGIELDRQPAGDRAGSRSRGGHEAVPGVRMAAAGDGRRGGPQGDSRRKAGGLRPRGDPAEARDLGAGANLPSALRTRLEEYPVPSPEAARAPDSLDEEARARLASLGYVSAGAAPVVRKDAPRPVDMTRIFGDLERASGLFASGQYAEVVPAAGKDPEGGSVQPRRRAAPRDRALVARARCAALSSSSGRPAQLAPARVTSGCTWPSTMHGATVGARRAAAGAGRGGVG